MTGTGAPAGNIEIRGQSPRPGLRVSKKAGRDLISSAMAKGGPGNPWAIPPLGHRVFCAARIRPQGRRGRGDKDWACFGVAKLSRRWDRDPVRVFSGMGKLS